MTPKVSGPRPFGLPLPFLLAFLFFASLALAHPAAARAQSQPVGTVVVERGQEVPEVSTGMGDVKVFGVVSGDVRSASGSILVDGPVGGNVSAGVGDVKVQKPVTGSVNAGVGNVYVNSAVRGNVGVEHGTVYLGPKARVGGDVYCGNGSWDYSPKAVVAGQTRTGPPPDFGGGPDGDRHVLGFAGWAFSAALFAALVVLASVVMPGPLSASAKVVGEAPLRSVLLGAGSVAAAVVVFVVLLISGIGIPILVLLAPLYLAFLFFGTMAVAYFVGRKVAFVTGGYRHGSALAALVGAVIVAAVFLLPFGTLLLGVIALLGAGAALLAIFSRKHPRSPYTPRLGSRMRR